MARAPGLENGSCAPGLNPLFMQSALAGAKVQRIFAECNARVFGGIIRKKKETFIYLHNNNKIHDFASLHLLFDFCLSVAVPAEFTAR